MDHKTRVGSGLLWSEKTEQIWISPVPEIDARAVSFGGSGRGKWGLALTRYERRLSLFSGLIPSIRSKENRQSVEEVVRTLLEAVVLVGIVVMVFLQNWRAAIIPLVAVPVAIVGTFAVMIVLGFSLNNISLFGLVLAIGIVVDDAIVVVENVERWLEQGLNPRDATRKAMDEVTGPVIAVALVL